MKLSNKKYILITMLISVLMLSGCSYISFDIFNAADKESEVIDEDNKDSEDIDKDSNQELNNNNKVTDVKSETNGKQPSPTPTPVKIQPIANKDLIIYSINPNSSNIEAVTAVVSNEEDITPQLIVDKVVEAMADQSIIVGIDSVKTEDDIIIVNFKSDYAPLNNVGSGIEATILDAIAQSLIDNLDDYNKVIYRVEDQAYASGHIEMKLNEIYLER